MAEVLTPEPTGAEHVVWDLSVFYAGIDDPAIERDMARAAEQVDAFAARYRGRVAQLSAAEMAESLQTYEAIMDAYERVGAFIWLTYVTDTTNPQYGALLQKYTEHSAELTQKLLFFKLEWNEADNAAAAAVLADPALGKYRHYLEAERRFKPHQLSEAEEQLLVEKNVTGRNAWTRLFMQITSAAHYEIDGERLNESQALAKLYEPDRTARRKAADAITETLRGRAMEVTYIFNVLAADKAADDRRRSYPAWISAWNLMNKASDAVVETLVTTVTANYELVARHYRLKRALLGYDELLEYDRYAPLPIEAAERSYRWDEASEIVRSAYRAFSPRLGEIVERFFSEQWIHAALMPTKRGGAFASATVPSAHPFILLNYTGKARDITTLAHELGHGVHMYLSAQAQGYIGAHTPLTTAEMASVFGELLVFSDLMQKEPDAAARLSMLMQKLEETFATVFRQISLNRFEDAYHNLRRSAGELSTERLNELWLTTQQAMFGDSLRLRDEYGIWWSYISHFVNTPGYVYAYAFGELLVLALFNLYRERGAAFAPQYLDVLAAGDSDYPERILATIGVDLTDPAFWNEGIDAIRKMVDEEETLARSLYPAKFAPLAG